MEYGADLYTRDEQNVAPIDEIIRTDNIDLLKCVYKPKKKISQVGGIHGIIHQASSVDDSKCLRLLLNIGVSANDMCNAVDKAQPLHFAVISNCLGNVQLLIENGGKPNSQDVVGNTALHLAVQTNNLEMVKLLDKCGADATVENH